MGRGVSVWLLASVLVLLLGCATTPPPLPAAYPDELPEVWLDALESGPCVASIDARVRLRIHPPDRAAVNLDGNLRASLPDTLRLSGKVGVFRPVFQFVTVAGYSELLLHDARAFWIVPSDEPDWETMNPAAWRRAILWSLCPQSLLRTFRPDDRGSMSGRLWTVSGTLVGTPYAVTLDVEPKSRSVRSIRLENAGDELLTAELGDYRFLEDAWVPQRASLRIRQPDGMTEITIELVGASNLAPGALEGKGLIQPAGWEPVFELGLSLPTDLGEEPTPK